MNTITAKQARFLRTLVTTRIGRSLTIEEEARMQALTIKAASVAIESEVARAEAETKQSEELEVPDGFYAFPGPDGTIRFYRLKTRDRGRWKGSQFVSVQASDEFHHVKSRAARDVVKTRILAMGLEESGRLYASELGRCYMCGRTLTDELSRALGVGPVCRGDES